MKVTVKFFAVCRDLTQTDTVTLPLPAGASGNDLWAVLLQKHPELSALKEKIRLAVNLEYVNEKVELKDGDQVSLIPPVSGG